MKKNTIPLRLISIQNTLFLVLFAMLGTTVEAAPASKKLDLQKLLAAGNSPDAQVTYFDNDGNSTQNYFLMEYKPPVVFKNYSEFSAGTFSDGEMPFRKVVLGKGLIRIGQLHFCGRHYGPVVEGSGPETIIVADDFYRNKDINATADLTEKSGCVLRNLTVVNLNLRATAGIFINNFVNVYFAGNFTTSATSRENFQDRAFTCQGCVFDALNFGGFEKEFAVIAGSVLWSEAEKKYLPLPSPDFNPSFTAYFKDLQKKHEYGGLALADKSLASSALISMLAIERNKLGNLVEDPFAKGLERDAHQWESKDYYNTMSYLLMEQYGLHKIAKPEILTFDKAIAKIQSELKANRPLSAMVYVGRLPENTTAQQIQSIKSMFTPHLEKLGSRYKSCNVSVDYSKEFLKSENITKSSDFKVSRVSGGSSYELIRDDFAFNLLEKFPFMFLAPDTTKKCNIAVEITRDVFSSWVDSENTVGYHQEIDWEGALAADQARSAARDAGLRNFSAGMQAGFQAMEKTWTTFRDTRTHFDKHVGGTDLVSYKVTNATNPGAAQDAIARQRDSLSTGSSDLGMKMAEHNLVTYKKFAKAEFTGSIIQKIPGQKDSVTNLTPIIGQWTLTSCSVKMHTSGGEIKAVNEEASTCKQDIQGGNDYGGFMYKYSKINIHPHIERYVDQYLVKDIVKDYQALSKSKSSEQKAEANLLLRMFGVSISGNQLVEVLERFETATAEKDFIRGARIVAGY